MTETQTNTHPLLTGTLSTIASWEEWKERWDAAAMLEERLGLLHVGLSAEWAPYNHKPLLFYLEVANGHHDGGFPPLGGFELNRHDFNSGSFGRRRSLPAVLKTLARKALSEL